MDESWPTDGPVSEGSPIEKLREAKARGIAWQGLYARDAEVREFVDTLIGVVTGGKACTP